MVNGRDGIPLCMCQPMSYCVRARSQSHVIIVIANTNIDVLLPIEWKCAGRRDPIRGMMLRALIETRVFSKVPRARNSHWYLLRIDIYTFLCVVQQRVFVKCLVGFTRVWRVVLLYPSRLPPQPPPGLNGHRLSIYCVSTDGWTEHILCVVCVWIAIWFDVGSISVCLCQARAWLWRFCHHKIESNATATGDAFFTMFSRGIDICVARVSPSAGDL